MDEAGVDGAGEGAQRDVAACMYVYEECRTSAERCSLRCRAASVTIVQARAVSWTTTRHGSCDPPSAVSEALAPIAAGRGPPRDARAQERGMVA